MSFDSFNIHTILFATDLSEGSLVPLRWAGELAYLSAAKLVILHVLPLGQEDSVNSSTLREQAQDSMNELVSVSNSVLAAKQIKSEIIVRVGNVRDTIFEIQQGISANIVVVGSSGKSVGHGIGRGSTAESIARSLPCPVVAVGPAVKRFALPSGNRTLIFLSDLTETSLSALPAAISLARGLSASVLLLHVTNALDHGHKLVNKVESKLLRDLMSTLKDDGVPFEMVMKAGSVKSEVLSLAEQRNTNLIVMGLHRSDLEDGTRLHGTFTSIVREASCPVVAVISPS